MHCKLLSHIGRSIAARVLRGLKPNVSTSDVQVSGAY